MKKREKGARPAREFKRIKGTLTLPKREAAEATPSQHVSPQSAQPREGQAQETEPRAPAPEMTASTKVDAERVLKPEEIAAFCERYGLEPEEFDALYATARKAVPQYGIDYAIDVAALKERCAALKNLIARGDAPSARASLLAEALLTYGAVADARAGAAANKRKT